MKKSEDRMKKRSYPVRNGKSNRRQIDVNSIKIWFTISHWVEKIILDCYQMDV